IERQIIFKKGDGQNLIYGIQKDYEKWCEPLSKSITVNNDKTIIEIDNIPLSKSITKPLSKSINTKERNKYLKKYKRKNSYSIKDIPSGLNGQLYYKNNFFY